MTRNCREIALQTRPNLHTKAVIANKEIKADMLKRIVVSRPIIPKPNHLRTFRIATLCGAALLPLSIAYADVVIPAGGFVSLSSGGLDVSCTDLVLAGTLQTNSAPVFNVRNVIIQSGGILDAGSSTFTLSGNWTNNGTFNAGTSTINFGDGCTIATATVSGNSTFNNVSYISTTGKTWQFASGSTQTVGGVLTIQGTPTTPVNLTSTQSGQPANILPQGTQSISNLNFNNGNVIIGALAATPTSIPTLGNFAMILLTVLLGASSFFVSGSTHSRNK